MLKTGQENKNVILSWEMPKLSEDFKTFIDINEIYFVYNIAISDKEEKG